MNNFLTNLDKNGYVLFRNELSKEQINNGLKSIKKNNNKTQINYSELKKFIDTDFFGVINKNLGWNSVYQKFKFSNKSNPRDASTFHSDIRNLDYGKTMPIYTCLIYFDDAILEIIPGSHKRIPEDKTCYYFSNRTQLIMKEGDILVFNANLYHRGIFYNKSKSTERKLLQVFDVYPNKEILNKYEKNYAVVITKESYIIKIINNLSELTSKFKILNENLNYFHFYLVNKNLQYYIYNYELSKNIKYIGFIPGNIKIIEKGKLQDWNININVMKHTNVLTNFKIKKIYLASSILILLVFIFIIIKLIKK